ncbi:MAG TPA: efflux RND transporter periplasmic adaptor subunit, partial [Pirellulales bacterium]|jgi:cobalt-zinc-cadmium efflux system membrane fusion protein|nr:efflux RND transporter periplasmic adaptor subunit [Pirellulales bacterium]
MPKASALFGASTTANSDWCSEHLVPESVCVECQPEGADKPTTFGFCRKHGVAECVNCHPELAQVEGSPTLPTYDTAEAIAVVDRPTNNSRNMLHQRRVQFASAEAATRAGVDVDVVSTRSMSDAITANGELMFDPTRVAHLSSRVAGTVSQVFKTLGDEVQPGEILALVDAASVGQAKSQLLHAIAQLQLRAVSVQRMRKVADSLSERAVLEAETAFQEAEIGYVTARQTLVNLGFEVPERLDLNDVNKTAKELGFLGIPPDYVSRLPSGNKTTNLLPIRAPYSGMIVASDIVSGEVVDTTNTLFIVADPDRLWLTLAVRQEEARFVRPGLPVSFKTDDGSEEVTGKVSWVSPAIDERTRTLAVRVLLANHDAKLRDKTFGTGRIVLREEPDAVVVPIEAVQSTADAHFVFVRDRDYLKDGAPKVFHVRQVRLGAKDGRYVEILAGALPGEVIATKGSPVILAQLLRSNLGAGCGCHEH